MARPLVPSSANNSVYAFLVDSTTLAPKTGVAYTAVTISYRLQGAAPVTNAAAQLASLTTAHTDWGWIEVDATNHPGLYRVDLPDAAVVGTQDVVVGASASGALCISITYPLNFLSGADVQTDCSNALIAYKLDKLFAAALSGGDIANNSYGAKLVSKSATATFTDFDNTTDALQAIRDNMGTAQTGDAFARLGAPVLASISADIASVLADTANLKTRIPAALVAGLMPVDAVAISGSTTAADGVESNIANLDSAVSAHATVDQILYTQIVESYAPVGTAPTLAQAILGIQQFQEQKSRLGSTISVKGIDRTTVVKQFALDSPTKPTAISRTL